MLPDTLYSFPGHHRTGEYQHARQRQKLTAPKSLPAEANGSWRWLAIKAKPLASSQYKLLNIYNHNSRPCSQPGTERARPAASVTVAILAQGTSWAVAVTQAFLAWVRARAGTSLLIKCRIYIYIHINTFVLISSLAMKPPLTRLLQGPVPWKHFNQRHNVDCTCTGSLL